MKDTWDVLRFGVPTVVTVGTPSHEVHVRAITSMNGTGGEGSVVDWLVSTVVTVVATLW
jgi:hypothetical protein